MRLDAFAYRHHGVLFLLDHSHVLFKPLSTCLEERGVRTEVGIHLLLEIRVESGAKAHEDVVLDPRH